MSRSTGVKFDGCSYRDDGLSSNGLCFGKHRQKPCCDEHMSDLQTLTEKYEHNKALQRTADRLIQLALQQGPALVHKAAVTAVGTGDMPALVADPDSQPLIQQVQRRSVIGRLLALGAVSVPPNRRLPGNVEDPEPTWISEGAPIPLARLTTASMSVDAKKFALMLAFTTELIRLGDTRARNLILTRSQRALV